MKIIKQIKSYFNDDQYFLFRRSMKLWDKKLYRLDNELLTYIHAKCADILERRMQEELIETIDMEDK